MREPLAYAEIQNMSYGHDATSVSSKGTQQLGRMIVCTLHLQSSRIQKQDS